MGKGKAKRGIPSKVDDFNAWYPFIVEAAEPCRQKISYQRNGRLEALWMAGNETD